MEANGMVFQPASTAFRRPSIASIAGHRLAGLNTLSTAVHRCQGLRGHVLRDLVQCQAMQPEWVRRVHEALKLPAQASKAPIAPFSLHQQLQVARCSPCSQSAYAAQLLTLLGCTASCHGACAAVPVWMAALQSCCVTSVCNGTQAACPSIVDLPLQHTAYLRLQDRDCQR